MAETGCLKDGHFNNLEVENTTIMTGKLTVGSTSTSEVNYVSPIGLSPVKIIHSQVSRAPIGGFYPSIIGAVEATDIEGFDMPACEALFNYLSNVDALSSVQSTHLFGISASKSQTSTIIAAADSALDSTCGYARAHTPQFLTGSWSATADIGAVNPFANMSNNAQHLIIFGGNNSTGDGVLTFSLSAEDKVDATASAIAVTGIGDQVWEFAAKGNTLDDGVDITLTPEKTTKILKGSFIYLENHWNHGVMVRGYIKVSGGKLTAALPNPAP